MCRNRMGVDFGWGNATCNALGIATDRGFDTHTAFRPLPVPQYQYRVSAAPMVCGNGHTAATEDDMHTCAIAGKNMANWNGVAGRQEIGTGAGGNRREKRGGRRRDGKTRGRRDNKWEARAGSTGTANR